MSTTRYQEGSIVRTKRAKGLDVWVYRWRVSDKDGNRVQKKKVIGDVGRYPTKAAAKKAVENFRAEINAEQEHIGKVTVSQAWGDFQQKELRNPEIARSATTIDTYLNVFQAYIIPRWGSTALEDIKPVEMESWLHTLRKTRKDESMAPASRAKVKSAIYTLIDHAMRHELCNLNYNPMEKVRQGSKRVQKPEILTLDEIRKLMLEISNPAIRLAVMVAGATGLRRSEVRGLKWHDLDLEAHWITPTQGVVGKHITNLKSRASGERIPIPEALSAAFEEWRKQTLYLAPDDWVFASVQTEGKSPLWFDSALHRQLRPAAKRVGIIKHLGWHTFRRSLASVLTSKKETVKVVQELMRHADPRITMEVYAQGEEQEKRKAQEHVSGLFLVDTLAS